jgi:diaminopimelate decarboxylase
MAYPESRLVGVDYSTRSTGLHAAVFDELWIQRPWSELALDRYATSVSKELAAGALWISGLDLEAKWLAGAVGQHLGLLGPDADTIAAIGKPADRVALELGLLHPPTISGMESDWELHRFCREHGWRVWLKAPNYQAFVVRSWVELQQTRAHLQETWGKDHLHLQAHVAGLEESVTFAAWRGRLAGAAHMTKRITTEEGKTWAGRIAPFEQPEDELARRLGRMISSLGWSGGAELEMIRDVGGQVHLIECNPRFPAWIHGATLAGANLPGALVEAAAGTAHAVAPRVADEFVRVVIEIPVRTSHPLPMPTVATDGGMRAGKHPSGMPSLAHRMGRSVELPRRAAPPFSENEQSELAALMDRLSATPAPLFLEESTRQRWHALAAAAGATHRVRFPVRLAYSVKTNPDSRLITLAAACGFLAEVISSDEAIHARTLGFNSDQIIYNGPAKSWPGGPLKERSLAVFADSLDELWRLTKQDVRATYLGPRVRLPGINSRFGIDVDEFANYRELIASMSRLPQEQAIGVHFHHAASDLGWRNWRRAAAAIVTWAAGLQSALTRPIRCLDLGGGWDPSDWSDALSPMLDAVTSLAANELPDLELLLLEPGKALSQPAFAVATEVLELRGGHEVVVDASIAELPQAPIYPHRALRRSVSGIWKPLETGTGRVLGRLCMEGDVLVAGVAVDDLREGERLAITDAGGYDRSMAYTFGRG